MPPFPWKRNGFEVPIDIAVQQSVSATSWKIMNWKIARLLKSIFLMNAAVRKGYRMVEAKDVTYLDSPRKRTINVFFEFISTMVVYTIMMSSY